MNLLLFTTITIHQIAINFFLSLEFYHMLAVAAAKQITSQKTFDHIIFEIVINILIANSISI